MQKRFKHKQRRNLFSLAVGPRKTSAPVNVVKNKAKANVLTKSKKPYPRLLDDSQRLALQREFSPYSALAAWYYSSTAKIASYLRANLNSRQTVGSRLFEGKLNAISVNRKNPALDYQDLVKNTTRSMTNAGKRLDIRGENVLVNMEPFTFEVSLALDDIDATNDLGRKLSKLFGTPFKFPTSFTVDETGARVLNSDKYSTGLKGVDFYSKLNFPYDPYPETFQPKALDISPIDMGVEDDEDEDEDNEKKSKGMRRNNTSSTGIKDVLKTEVKITQMTTLRNKGASADDVPHAALVITFAVMGVCQFPLEYALWATYSTDITEFVPKLFREHFDNIGQMLILNKGGNYRANLHARTMHLGIVKQLNNERIKEYGIEVRSRVNAENFCIMGNGEVLYVPQVDNTEFYVSTLRASYNTENGMVKQNSEIPELANKVILVDWINDQLAYTDNNGKPSNISLSGAISLDDVTIRRKLMSKFIGGEDNDKFWQNFGNYGNHVCTQFNLYINPAVSANFAILTSQIAIDAGNNSVGDWSDIVSQPVSGVDDIYDKSRIRFNEWVRLCASIAKNIMNCDRLAISSRMTFMIWYYTFGIYIKNIRSLAIAWAENVKANSKPDADELKTQFDIPNAPGIKMLLPHQQELGTVVSRQDPPKFMVLQISAGGGKTLQLFLDAMKLKQNGKVKTAMIVCPGSLVKEWTTEINKMSKGEINVVPLTTSVIKKMRDHLNFDKLKFIEYLKNVPTNTIFICSVNFLGLPKDHFDDKYVGGVMQYGETFVRFFPNVQILRQLNPDYIAIDEAHFLKNFTSRRTKSYFALSPVSTYRRIASGTISPDNLADMVPQYGTLNPAILGTKDQFIDRYGIGSNGKLVQLKKDAEKELDAVRAPYINRIIKTRADWSFLLPNIYTTLTKCYMTDSQQAFYNFMFTDEMRKLRNDPKIKKLLEEADEAKAVAIERLLQTRLNILEEFVNAPDTSTTFVKWAEGFDIDDDGQVLAAAGEPRAKLVAEDFISCKVKEIDEVLDTHLKTSKNKVIIFGINKKVSKHIFTKSKYRGLMVHYAAGMSLSGYTSAEALQQFRNNAKIRIICADAGSMRVGLNLQMADMVFYTQTEWSPGDQEQAFSRAMRPDVGDTFKRESVSLIKLFAENTFEVAKTAKLINKEVTVKQSDNSQNPYWNEFVRKEPIDALIPIKMNLDTIANIRNFEHPDVSNSIKWYRKINSWEVEQFGKSKERLINYTAHRLGMDPADVDLKRDAMLPVDSKPRLPGSKYYFTPLENGAIPIDRRQLNMVPIATAKVVKDDEGDSDNDDNEDDEDENKIELDELFVPQKGDVVYTEYGYGRVQTNLKKQVKIFIPGFPRPPGSIVTLSKLAVFKPQKPDYNPSVSAEENMALADQWQANINKLMKDIKKAGDKGITFINLPDNANTPKVEETRSVPVKPAVPIVRPNTPPPPPEEDVDDDTDENEILPPASNKFPVATENLEIIPIVINGVPALAAYTSEKGYAQLRTHGIWAKVPAFLSTHIKTFTGAQNMAKAIADAGLSVPNGPINPTTKRATPNQLARMQGLAQKMKSPSSNRLLVRSTTKNLSRDLKNALLIAHSEPDKNVVKVYPIIWNDQLFLTANVPQQQNQTNILKKLKVPGCEPWGMVRNFSVMMLNDYNSTKAMLKKINSDMKIENIDECYEFINAPIFKKSIGV